MMVLRGDVGAAANTLVGYIFPADRCSWEQVVDASGRGYGIDNANFYPGTTVTLGGVSAADFTIANAELGIYRKVR